MHKQHKGGRLFLVDGENLTIEEVIELGRSAPGEIRLALSNSAIKKIERARDAITEMERKRLTIYGLNTGFGSNAEKVIPESEIKLLQRFLIVSHAVGVGEPFKPEFVRAAMLIRANTLSRGNSGIRKAVVETLIDMLNRGVTPYVPQRGSLGASGDLAPLSHTALSFTMDPREAHQKLERELARRAKTGVRLTGGDYERAVKESGEAYLWESGTWTKMSGIEAMARAGIERIVLDAKEGLALNNGCSFSAAVGCFDVYYGERLQESADVISALSVEALEGFESAFSPEISGSRPHSGQIEVARRLRRYLKGSKLVSHIGQIQNSANVMKDFQKVQDSYSLRCIPQVHGPVLDSLKYVRHTLEVEINSSTDNPLVFPDSGYLNKVFSGGNFHGEYLALGLDHLGNALGVLGNISERRVFKLITSSISGGLPSFLITEAERNAGLMNGAMIMQYTAASLVSEDKVLSHPASADSITSSEDKEDFVSMAPISARKAYAILENVEYALAIELWCAIVGIRLRAKESRQPGDVGRKSLRLLKDTIPEFSEDRVAYDEIEKIRCLIHDGTVAGLPGSASR